MVTLVEEDRDVSHVDQPDLEFFKPLVNGWLGKIEASRKHRENWMKQAKECMHFYALTKELNELLGKGIAGLAGVQAAPKFQMVIAKAFELVAQVGPSLYFNDPDRKVTPKRLSELPPMLFGDVENDPQAQQLYQAYEQERVGENAECEGRATLLEHWLKYTPGEMPGGGLEKHAQRAITEALIKGRGTLWIEPYTKASSDRTLTGLFYDTVDNLFLDPDATKMDDVRWMAQRVVEHYREAEDRFGLPRGTLKSHTSVESMWAEGERSNNEDAAMHSANGTSKDLIVYYRIWSKAGLGVDYVGGDAGVNSRLDKVVGKYGYVVVCNGVSYPLNAPSAKLRAGASDEQVRDMFEWPIPYWTDDMWPVEILDFYEKPNSIYPIPPLSPGMGELKFLSIMMSQMCNRIWMSSRDFIAVAKSAMSEVANIIKKGDDLSILPIADVHGSVDKMISFVKQPEVNLDVWTIIDRVSDQFDKRTGLTDLVYGMSATQSRSAEDASIKGNAVSVRPEYMSRQVERWLSEGSRKEAFCTRWFVNANDVQPLLGNVGSRLWSALIDDKDVDAVVREMDYKIAAGSTKRRNKETELANLNQALQFFFPELSKHADATTDTSALNALIQRWGDASEMDLSDIKLGQRMPPQQEGPSPEEAEMQMKQEEHQLEMQSSSQMHQMKMQELAAKVQAQQAQMQIKMQSDQQNAQTKAQTDQQASQTAQRQGLIEMLVDRSKHTQEMRQDEETHGLDIELSREKAAVELEIAKKKADAAVAAAKAAAKAKPKSTSNTGSK